MKKQIKMVAFDLDGTILTTQKELGEYTRSVMAEAVRQGVIMVPATGRPIKGVPSELREFPGIRYFVTANGARVIDAQENAVLLERTIPVETTKRVMHIFSKYAAFREIHYKGVGYSQADELRRVSDFIKAEPVAEYVRATRVPVENLCGSFEEGQWKADKVVAIFASDEEQKKAKEEVKSVKGIAITGALGNNIEVNAENVDKGNALLMLGDRLGIQREEIMALGDGDNDIGMLKMAGVGIAMNNAIEAAKEAADKVTASNDEEGAARAMERYVLV